MRIRYKTALATLALASLLQAQESRPATPQPTPTKEQLAVYAAFIPEYTKGADFQLVVADQAVPIKLADLANDACVRLAKFVTEQPEGTLQMLGPEFQKLGKIKLVEPKRQSTLIRHNDPSAHARDSAERGRPVTEKDIETWSKKAYQSGMLTVSMVKFDTTRRLALVEYTFECGARCGYGGLMLFENVKGKWVKKKNCPTWIS